ncbi:MAG: glycosyltransferase family 39 protein [Pyrinomonadaceae bacterium]|nr:glycosyltransferase family 39 protein [Pyrinomonadaceae bacterium]
MTIKGMSWRDSERITWLLFAVAVVAVYFFALDVPLLGPDEPRYAQVAREMFERGDLVTPTLGGYNWFEKPALLYWLQYFSFSLFGIGEFAARFGSALFGLGTITSMWLLGRAVSHPLPPIDSLGPLSEHDDPALSTQHSDLSTHTSDLGWWLALITATSLGLMAFSRGGSFDIVITFPVTASLVSFYIYEHSDASNRAQRYISLSLFYAFIGVGLIGKGLIGAVFPGAIVVFYFLLCRRWPRKELILSALWGSVIVLIVAGFWYLPMFLTHGWEFWDEFFVQHHFQRYTSNKYKHPGPFWFFFLVLPLMTIPWIPFFIAAIWKSVRRFIFRKTPESGDFIDYRPDLVKFAFSWLLVPLVFFSLSGSKLPGYILPALPAAAVIAGLAVVHYAKRSNARQLLIKYLAFITLVVVVSVLRFALPVFARDDSMKHLVEVADGKGYSKSEILNLHTIVHSLEFYGAGRLVREDDGKQWKFLGDRGIVGHIMKNGGKPVLVAVPPQFEAQLTTSPFLNSEVLGRTSEITMVGVSLRKTGGTKR